MTTVAEYSARIQRRLYSGSLARYDFLNGAVDSTTETVVLADGSTGIMPGVQLGLELELVLVRNWDASSKTATVLRGFLGTEQAAHADMTAAEVGPRFALGDIVESMQEEIASWDDRLFRVETRTISTAGSRRGYDLTGAIEPLFLLAVTCPTTSAFLGVASSDNAKTPVPCELLRTQPISAFPSTFAVQLKDFPATALDLTVVWAEKFIVDDWSLTIDLQDDVGLETSQLDVVQYGVMARLLAGVEIGRVDTRASGIDRRAAEVPPGYPSHTADWFLNRRNTRLATEANRLRGLYPYRMD